MRLKRMAEEVDQFFPEAFSTHLILEKEDELARVSQSSPVWIDSSGKLHERLHITTPTLMFVRPNGYIGFRWRSIDRQALLTFLDSYLIRCEA